MTPPDEPLLPEEPPRRSSLRLWILAGGALLAAGGAAAIALLRSPPAPPADPVSVTLPETPLKGAGRSGPGSPARPAPAAELAAEELFQAAEAFDRSHPDAPEQAASRYLEVFHRHPTSPPGRKAEEKARGLERSRQAALDREAEDLEKAAEALAQGGRFREAIEKVQAYRKLHPAEGPARRAERELARLENASRDSFNRAARQAGELARGADYPGAIAAFEGVRSGATPEVAERSAAAIAQLREAKKASDAYRQSRSVEQALESFRLGPGPKILALLRARRYEEGLAGLDAARAEPGALPLLDDLARERAAMGQAGAFWEAFLKTVRAKATQDLSFAPNGPKGTRTTGRLVRIGADRMTVDTGDAAAEVLFDQISLDQVVAWTIGKSLPADDGATYLKAALFFFVEGRDDLARTYLATAKEGGADIAEAERVFREGLLRASLPPK